MLTKIILYLNLILLIYFVHAQFTPEWTIRKHIHRPKTLSKEALEILSKLSDNERFKNEELKPFLKTRVSGTPGNREVQEHIIHQLQALNWSVETHSFTEQTPYGILPFTNIIGTLNVSAPRRLVLACHFDSKYFPNQEFIGATDSAVPCAMILDLISLLNPYLKCNHNADDLTLQLIFFDGEEAFVSWTETDSLYGSRKLAEKMEFTLHPQNNNDHTTILDGIDILVLLDLIGAANPNFYNFFENTALYFTRFVGIEKRLHQYNLLSSHIKENEYFMENSRFGGIEDDHIPFLRRGVRILHLITSPFPSVWHTLNDNEKALDYTVIDNMNKIFRVFIAEYFRFNI